MFRIPLQAAVDEPGPERVQKLEADGLVRVPRPDRLQHDLRDGVVDDGRDQLRSDAVAFLLSGEAPMALLQGHGVALVGDLGGEDHGEDDDQHQRRDQDQPFENLPVRIRKVLAVEHQSAERLEQQRHQQETEEDVEVGVDVGRRVDVDHQRGVDDHRDRPHLEGGIVDVDQHQDEEQLSEDVDGRSEVVIQLVLLVDESVPAELHGIHEAALGTQTVELPADERRVADDEDEDAHDCQDDGLHVLLVADDARIRPQHGDGRDVRALEHVEAVLGDGDVGGVHRCQQRRDGRVPLLHELRVVLGEVHEERHQPPLPPLQFDPPVLVQHVGESRSQIAAAAHDRHQEGKPQLQQESLPESPPSAAGRLHDVHIEVQKTGQAEQRDHHVRPLQMDVADDVGQLRPVQDDLERRHVSRHDDVDHVPHQQQEGEGGCNACRVSARIALLNDAEVAVGALRTQPTARIRTTDGNRVLPHLPMCPS